MWKSEDEFQTKFGMDNVKKEIKELEDLNLNEELLRGIYSFGFEKLSPCQQKAVFPIIHSNPPANVICASLSCTGKTTSHVISVLQTVSSLKEKEENKNTTSPLSLVIVQSKELIYGVCYYFKKLSKFMEPEVKVHGCVKPLGLGFEEDIVEISEGIDVIVSTTDRIVYLVKEGYLDLSQIKMLVFDQLDELFQRGFKEKIESICKDYIPPNDVQICVFSGLNITSEMSEFLEKFVRDPILIRIETRG
ncbi:hypothetical protein ABK040_007789 [Willaertia magna]